MARFTKRYNSKIGTTEQCLKFAEKTEMDLSGWWYHADTEANTKNRSNGTETFDSDSGKLKDKISFTRDPKGAARNYENWETDNWVLRATINANPRSRLVDLDRHSLTNDHDWAHVWDVRCIMIEKGSATERSDGESHEANEAPKLLPDARIITRS